MNQARTYNFLQLPSYLVKQINNKRFLLYPVDILDLFPMLRKGFAIKETIQCLFWFLECYYNLDDFINSTTQDGKLFTTLEQEFNLANAISSVMEIYLAKRSVEKQCTLYELIRKAISQQGCLTNKIAPFITAVLNHPQVDPLFVCILTQSYRKVTNYFNDSRSNLLIAYIEVNGIAFMQYDIVNLASNKLLLIKQILSRDICAHIIHSGFLWQYNY